MKDFATPQYATPQEIKQARKLLGLTQKDFARLIGSSTPTVERWEAGDKSVAGPIALLVKLMIDDPERFMHLILPEKKLPIRLKYMYQQHLCTVIDVDEGRRDVQIWNFTEHLQFRAFGANERPSYEDYCAFLESRCFPESRDKMKLVLADLDIPFYDPLLIIEKTQGKMAEDDFWIEIVR